MFMIKKDHDNIDIQKYFNKQKKHEKYNKYTCQTGKDLLWKEEDQTDQEQEY